MSDEDRIAHLEGKLEALQELNAKPAPVPESPMESSGKMFKWLTPIISVVVVIIGLGITWGVSKTKIELLEAALAQTNETVSKVEDDIHELQIKQATTDPVITQIQADVSEIKQDVKKLAGIE